MSRVRSSVSALIARQPALIAQAVTFSNLTRTQAVLNHVSEESRTAVTRLPSCFLIYYTEIEHISPAVCVMFRSVLKLDRWRCSLSLSLSLCKAIALMAHLSLPL